MWIAKPLSSLDQSDRAAWERTLQATRFRDGEVPLAQTPAWGGAIESLGARCWWIGSLDQPVGGLVYADPRQEGVLECQNGPMLDWDRKDLIASQFALFAQACSRVLGPRFRALSAHPRWRDSKLDARLALLPIDATSLEYAETRVVPVAASDDLQVARFSPRLRRSLRKTMARTPEFEWRPFEPGRDTAWIAAFQAWGLRRSFFVPPKTWFEALAKNLPLFLATAQESPDSAAGGLYAVFEGSAHYLFGAPLRADAPRTPAALGAVVHFMALRHLAEMRIPRLDLNGDMTEAPSNHPYRGVAELKRQLGGEPIRYAVPEFRIEA